MIHLRIHKVTVRVNNRRIIKDSVLCRQTIARIARIFSKSNAPAHRDGRG